MTNSSFYKPNKTFPRKFIANTKSCESKKDEWLQIEGCPCIVLEMTDEDVVLNSFASSVGRNFKVSKDEFKTQFVNCVVEDGFIMGLDKYPNGKIHASEFDKRVDVNKLKKQIEECLKQTDSEIIKKIIKDKKQQMFDSQGAPCVTIPNFIKFINNELVVGKLEHFGEIHFNRNCRWCPPVDISFEEFKASNSYPAPLGIRPKDFCLPSELIDTIKELIRQIMSFDKIESNCFKNLILESDENKHNKHRCHWCNVIINADEYSSEYGSKDNFIEICHKDPNDRFLKTNMYWGHGECNRRQGGYSERERIEDALKLLKHNIHYLNEFRSDNPFV
jgi:hypothetical protein